MKRVIPILVILVVLVILAGAAVLVILRGAPATTTQAPSSPTSTGWYQLFFTTPRIPDDRAGRGVSLDKELVALIDRATRTLEVADYDFDLANVAGAMVRARQRGVIVRMVTDSETVENTRNAEVQAAFAQLRQGNIPIVEDNRGPIMHNKFTVVDEEWVSTGSWNYTDGDTYRLNNNMIIIRSRELALNYRDEFNRMFDKKQFGPNKERGATNPVVTIEGSRVENYFAPKDKVADKIVAAVRQARTSVYFLAFSFTQDDIGNAIIERKRAGLTVSGVFETTGSNTQFSEFGRMKDAGLDVYTDGNPYVMHHKVIILDERRVIFGSFNFSENADTANDENLLIIDNIDLARAFKAEFDRILAMAKNPPRTPRGS